MTFGHKASERSLVILAASIAFMPLPARAGGSEMCTYTDWTWSSTERRPVDIREVEKPYDALREDERDSVTGCSLCREDQVEIVLDGVKPFHICRKVAGDIRAALNQAKADGFQFETITGYRVGRSKGVLDANGRRTQYSNHSFGLAIDINAEKNGLYDRCAEFSDDCRLLRGGAWQPGEPGGITSDTPLYQAMIAMGWQWGGILEGNQKDFMHFSPRGD